MASAPETKPEILDGEKAISVMDQDDDPYISNIEEKPLVRKIDLQYVPVHVFLGHLRNGLVVMSPYHSLTKYSHSLMPILIAIYILQYLDKSSLNTASLLGIIQDTVCYCSPNGAVSD